MFQAAGLNVVRDSGIEILKRPDPTLESFLREMRPRARLTRCVEGAFRGMAPDLDRGSVSSE